MRTAQFRTLCHSLGLSSLDVARLARVQPRSAQRWFCTDSPPPDVLMQMRQIDDDIGRAVHAAIKQAEEARVQHSGGAPDCVSLTAYRSAEQLHAACPNMAGLPLQTHSILLRRVQAALEQVGVQTVIVIDDAPELLGR